MSTQPTPDPSQEDRELAALIDRAMADPCLLQVERIDNYHSNRYSISEEGKQVLEGLLNRLPEVIAAHCAAREESLRRELEEAKQQVELWKTENESRAIMLRDVKEIVGHNNDDGFHSTLTEANKLTAAESEVAGLREALADVLDDDIVGERWATFVGKDPDDLTGADKRYYEIMRAARTALRPAHAQTKST